MQTLAQEFGVSGSYLSRVCIYLDVPKPGLGYWAKRAAGKKTHQPPLPPTRPGAPTSWERGVDVSVPLRGSERRLRNLRLLDDSESDGVHYLLREGRVHFPKTRTIDKGDYLRPFKRVLVDIRCSSNSLDRAFELASAIFKKLGVSGLRVGVASAHEPLRGCEIEERETPLKGPHHRYPRLWSPGRPTIVYGSDAAIGLTIVEMSELVQVRYVNGEYVRDEEYRPPSRSRHLHDRTWTTEKDLPSGRFRVVLYSPHPSVNWMESFQEKAPKTLENQISRIVSRVKSASKELVPQIEEARRQAEIEHQKFLEQQRIWREQEHKRRLLAARQESETQLRQGIARWSELRALMEFLDAAERSIEGLAPEAAAPMAERLRLAREMLGSIDPLEFLKAWQTPDEIYR